MQTYLFYDIETTGLNKAFDQVLQFAGIRTDLNLKEIERYELKVRLNPDVIPAPRAVITHHIGVKESQSGITEIEAIQQIHQWLNKPGTISLGYNTLGFDDEFLRFSFYRNLLSPYTHQFANQCSRMDIYPMALMYYLFKNDIIQWPSLNNKLSLKLDELNKTNQFVNGQAHQAIVDVEATVALAQRFHADQTMWSYLASHFHKQKDQLRVQQLGDQPGLMVDSFIGATEHYQCPVMSLGYHHHYKNQSMWLRLDKEDFSQIEAHSIQEKTRVTFKKMGEPSFILPLKERFAANLQPQRIELANNNYQWLKNHPSQLTQITHHYADYLYPAFPNVDMQASLYLSGFWSDEENNFCRNFHISSPKQKAHLTEQVKNKRLKTLAIRLLGKHFPECMTDSQQEEFDAYLQTIHLPENQEASTDHRGEKRLTLNGALNDIAILKTQGELTIKQLDLLDELEIYLRKKIL